MPHRPLLDKLSAVNVSPYILKWIASYLLNRMQVVCVCGVTSQLRHVLSGVPQGSVLGPLLFNFYINDITRIPLTAGTLSLYADDMMLYCQINSCADFAALQKDVDRLCVWTIIINFFNLIQKNANPWSSPESVLPPCHPLPLLLTALP